MLTPSTEVQVAVVGAAAAVYHQVAAAVAVLADHQAVTAVVLLADRQAVVSAGLQVVSIARLILQLRLRVALNRRALLVPVVPVHQSAHHLAGQMLVSRAGQTAVHTVTV